VLKIETYIDNLISLLTQKFQSRLLYVGLQGSYLRGDADEQSDIDIMVILDGLSTKDLELYRHVVESNGNADMACGFICGQSELANWNPCEICHLIHTTKDYYGKLAGLVPVYTKEDERNYIKISLNNLYHEICHRYIHASREKNTKALPQAYKSVFFILQNIYFQKTGDFIQTKKELLSKLSGADYEVLSASLELKSQCSYDFDRAYQRLFTWCQNTICAV
jgi:predicted nucleotidyltransferase